MSYTRYRGLGLVEQVNAAMPSQRGFLARVYAGDRTTTGGDVDIAVRDALSAQGITSPRVTWEATLIRVWYSSAEPYSIREAKILRGMALAAAMIGPSAYFQFMDGSRSPAAPAAPATPPGGFVSVTVPAPTSSGNTAVLDLQRLLAAKGFPPGTLDGRWGPNTAGALQRAAAAMGRTIAITARTGDSRISMPSADMRALEAYSASARIIPETRPGTIIGPDLDPRTGAPRPPTPDWLMWSVVGAVVVVGAGGFLAWRIRRRRQ